MKVEMVSPRYAGTTIITNPKAQRIADAIVRYEWNLALYSGATFTVYEIVTKYGLADILGTYSYTGRKPTNVADQVIRNAINDLVHVGVVAPTGDRRKGYQIYKALWP